MDRLEFSVPNLVLAIVVVGAIFGASLLFGLRNPALKRRIPDWGWKANTVFCALGLVLVVVVAWFAIRR